jgi:hypothetical protein
MSVTIPGVLRRFLERASIAYAGSRSRELVPHFHWVCGWLVEPDQTSIAFLVSEPFGERLLQDTAECPRLALTVEHIGPHETYQFKGAFAGTRPPGEAERAAFEACRERAIRDITAIETRFDFPRETLARYYGEPALVVLLRVEEVFLQTPGPGAGRRLVPPEAGSGDAAEPTGCPPAEGLLQASSAARAQARLPDEIQPVMESGVPVVLVTCSKGGEPNVAVVSQAHYLDAEHVAVSFQFFSKTIRNVRENPYAAICLHDIWKARRWLLDLRYDHSETDGPLYDRMSLEIEAIASATGMSGIFKLRSADVYRLLGVEPVPCLPE